jgi:hypothetical protein
MKERPILFSSEMVKAILDGRKTMTRRVIKWPHVEIDIDHRILGGCYWDEQKGRLTGQMYILSCPYGQTGDRLWVRETWQYNPFGGIVYRAGSGIVDCDGRGWKPSIFMPRRASRITLEITAVRVERVQDIDKRDGHGQHIIGDAWAEGFRTPNPTAAFMLYWDSLNAKRGHGWEKNPFVWTIAFKRIQP